MKIAISVSPRETKFGPIVFSGDLNKAYPKLKELGYHGIEMSLRDSSTVDQEGILENLEKQGLKLISIATGQSYVDDGFCLFTDDNEQRTRCADRLKNHINFAAKAGASVIIGGIRGNNPISGPKDSKYNQGIKTLKSLNDYAGAKEVTLLLEGVNRYEVSTFRNLSEISSVIDKEKLDSIKALPDTYHMNIEEPDILESFARYEDYIGAVHFSDSNRLAPGMGHINFQHIYRTVSKIKKLLYIGIEILPEPDGETAAKMGMNTLRLCGEEI